MTFYDKCKDRTKKLVHFSTIANQSYMNVVLLNDLQANKVDVLNISPAFYQSVRRACMQTLFIDIPKMFDKKGNNESTYNLFTKMKSQINQLESCVIEVQYFEHLDSKSSKTIKYQTLGEMLDDGLKLIEESRAEITRVEKLRHKYYAHLDLAVQNRIEELFIKNKISLADIEKLLTLNMNLLNMLYMYFFEKTVYPSITNANDLSYTVYCVEEYLNKYHQNGLGL